MMDGIDAKVERLAQRLLQAGAITDTHADKNFYRRLAAIDADWPGAAVMIHMERDLDAATRALWTNPKLLALVTSIIGPDLAGNPVWNLRSKTPATALTTVPWHQDIACAFSAPSRRSPPPAAPPALTPRSAAQTSARARRRRRSPRPGSRCST